MFNKFQLLVLLFSINLSNAQLNPLISSFLQNKIKVGTYYVSGNSTAISNGVLFNCQKVEYSATSVYITATGIPAYPTGPFLDGNPSKATNQNAIFKFPLNPVENKGTPTATTGGNIGIFINGVALFDYRDGVAWNATTNSLCGGPGNPPCPGGMGTVQDWNRDAILAERGGFDCSKAHPAMGNYHHHQNPSAFKLDLKVISNVCNLYDADGLYAIDSTKHSPLLGFAYDGFPIYGAYGYKNVDGTGGIVRIKSSYSLRNITLRNTSPTGSAVSSGPIVSPTYPLGYFREDYQYKTTTAATPDYLDEHNGRFCITPEYPKGIYCYFTTVDANWNSTYPYVVGPTFYGVFANRKVTSVNEQTTVYEPTTTGYSDSKGETLEVNLFPNPSYDFIVVQILGLNKENLLIELFDLSGKLVRSSTINPGATNTYLDTKTLYEGSYIVKISGSKSSVIRNVVLSK
ncbi:MAG: YHYH protein [Saprospiraceae bacterium]